MDLDGTETLPTTEPNKPIPDTNAAPEETCTKPKTQAPYRPEIVIRPHPVDMMHLPHETLGIEGADRASTVPETLPHHNEQAISQETPNDVEPPDESDKDVEFVRPEDP